MRHKQKSIQAIGVKLIACLATALGAIPAWAELSASPANQRDGQSGVETPRLYAPAATITPYRLAATSADDNIMSRDALFDDVDDSLLKSGKKSEKSAPSSGTGIRGFLQFNIARDYESPVHWSQMMTRADLSAQGDLGNGIKWKLGARVDYDAVYDVTDFYPSAVRHDQALNFYLGENYLDIGAGDWDFRLGKQNVVWGEMVGLFFADVVSARNMYQFILPSFDLIRITQWAARAEYFKDDFHAELLWIPVASYNQVGVSGAEFFPFVPPTIPGVATQYRNEEFPSRNLSNMNYGVRLSTLKNGWDVSGFAYSSMDIEPTFYRQYAVSPQPTAIYQARHSRINQLGGTLAKDFYSFVLKAEAVYTHGRHFYVSNPNDVNGVVPQNTLDWAVGLDFALPADTRFNAQVFQRDFFEYEPDLISDKHESGYSLLLNHKIGDKLEAEVTWISSFNRTDWLFRPRVSWDVERNWRLAVGVDVFKGPPLGFFGRFADRDRVYSEVRYNF